jgi:hypothetical protein
MSSREEAMEALRVLLRAVGQAALALETLAAPGGAISRQCSDRPGQGRAFFLNVSFVAQNRHLITLPSSSRAQVRVRRLIPRGHGAAARTPGAGSAGIGSRWPRHRPLVRRRHRTPPPRRTMCRWEAVGPSQWMSSSSLWSACWALVCSSATRAASSLFSSPTRRPSDVVTGDAGRSWWIM